MFFFFVITRGPSKNSQKSIHPSSPPPAHCFRSSAIKKAERDATDCRCALATSTTTTRLRFIRQRTARGGWQWRRWLGWWLWWWCNCAQHRPPPDSRTTCGERSASCAQRDLFLRRRRPYRITRAARRRRLSSWCVSSEPAKWPGHEFRGASFGTVSRSPQPQPRHALTASCTRKYLSVSSDARKLSDLKKKSLPSLHSRPPERSISSQVSQ